MVPRTGRDRSNEQGRVFVIRALATDERDWPDFLRDERGNSSSVSCFTTSSTRCPMAGPKSCERNEDFSDNLGRSGRPDKTLTRTKKRCREPSRANVPAPAPAIATVASPASISTPAPDAAARANSKAFSRKTGACTADSGIPTRQCVQRLHARSGSFRDGKALRCIGADSRRRQGGVHRRSPRDRGRRARAHPVGAWNAAALRRARSVGNAASDRRGELRDRTFRPCARRLAKRIRTRGSSAPARPARRCCNGIPSAKNAGFGGETETALSRAAALRARRMADLLRPRDDDRRGDRTSRRASASF